MKTLGKLLAALVGLILLTIVLVPLFISMDDVVAKINTSVKSNTGRTLSIDGEKHFSAFPSLVLTLEQVRFSNISAGSRADMASMAKLDVHIPWLSLFSGELKIDKFVIDKPDILLETTKDGINNWTLVGDKPSAGTTSASESGAGQSGTSKLPDNFDVNLGDIEIREGTLTLIDHQTGERKQFNNLGLAVELPSLHQPLKVKGTLSYMQQTFDLTTTIDTPAKAIENQPFGLEVALDSQLLQLNYKGQIKSAGKHIAGDLSVKGDSVKQILNWQKQPLQAKDNAFNGFSLNSNIYLNDNKIGFKGLEAKLDALAFKGDAVITLNKVPQVVLNIDLGELDLNPYLPEPVEQTQQTTAEKQPIVWDDTPIALEGLKAVNADIKVKSTALKARDIKLGANQFHLTLTGGKLNLAMEQFNAYQGKGTGMVMVNAARKPYHIETRFDLTDIDANPLLLDVAKFDKVLGKGSLNWQLSTQGVSQKDFVHALAGDLGFNLKDGAVKGANLAAIARSAQNLLTGNLSGVSLDKNFDNAEKTDFASFAATFQFQRGVGQNSDLALLNPFVEVSGQGSVDLPQTKIAMQVKTKLVGSMEGQTSGTGKSGLTLPIKITGPFHDVKVRPDISDSAKDKAKDTIKNKLKDLFG